MKKIRVNVFVLMLTIIYIIMTLTGCFFHKEKDTIKEQTIGNKQCETLTFYFPGEESLNARKILDEIEIITKDTLNIKFNFKWLSQKNYYNDLITLLSSGEDVDAVQIVGYDYNDPLTTFINKNLIADLTSILKSKAPNLYKSYGEMGLTNVLYDKKIMAIPDNIPKSSRICAIIKNSTANKYNIESIRDYDDLEKLLQALVDEKNNITPLGFNGDILNLFKESYGYIHIGNRLVYKQDDPEMKIIPWEQTNEFKKAVQKIHDWNEKKYFNASTLRLIYASNALEILSKDLSSVVLTDWDSAQSYSHTRVGLSQQVKVFPLYLENIAAKPENYYALAINKNSKKAGRVLQFLEWIQMSKENYTLFMYGINNVNYKLENDRISFIDDKSRYYGWSGSQVFLNFDYSYLSPFDNSEYKEEYKKITNDIRKLPPSTGFRPNFSKFEDIIKKRTQSYSSLNNTLFLLPIYSEEFIEEYINQNRNIGIDNMVSDIQRQLEEWKKK